MDHKPQERSQRASVRCGLILFALPYPKVLSPFTPNQVRHECGKNAGQNAYFLRRRISEMYLSGGYAKIPNLQSFTETRDV